MVMASAELFARAGVTAKPPRDIQTWLTLGASIFETVHKETSRPKHPAPISASL